MTACPPRRVAGLAWCDRFAVERARFDGKEEGCAEEGEEEDDQEEGHAEKGEEENNQEEGKEKVSPELRSELTDPVSRSGAK